MVLPTAETGRADAASLLFRANGTIGRFRRKPWPSLEPASGVDNKDRHGRLGGILHRQVSGAAESKQTLDLIGCPSDGQFQCFVDMYIVLRHIL